MFFREKIIFLLVCACSVTYENSVAAAGLQYNPLEQFDAHKEDEQENKDIYNVGGQIRLRSDFVKNQKLDDFSFSPDTHDEQILSRTRLNLSLEPIKQIKGFVQGQFYDRQNHTDYSKANLYQGYLELSDPEHIPIELKIGRQELCYGSAFFLGPNDFYDGLTWDGGKIRILPRDDLWIDLIGARYVKLNKNTSDDEPALYGIYTGYELIKEAHLDVYFFHHKGGFKFFHTDLPNSPKWFSLGARIAGKIGDEIDYEIEPLYQFGEIDNPDQASRDTISAYGGYMQAGYTFKSKYNPRLFFAYALGTGDNNTEDKKYREFHGNIYNDNYLVGDTSLIPDLSGVTVGDIRASGMHIFVSGVSTDLHPKLNLNLDYHYFLADKTAGGISKNLGSEFNLIFTYKPFHGINMIVSANRFFTGNFFKDAAGSKKDIDYFYISTQIDF